jgi:hypothetical protein
LIEESKNSGKGPETSWRNNSIFICLLVMLFSLVISRGALSVSLLIFLGLCIVHKNFAQQVNAFVKTPFLLLFSLLFFIPFLSGLWSSDIGKWSDVVRIKLPLLAFPLAFAGNWKLSQKQWLYIAATFLAMVFGGCVWGLLHYAQNTEEVHAGYLRAKTILTPLENDHVRFSWMVSVAAILCVLLVQTVQGIKSKALLIFLLFFFAVYLHILSARTGIVSLYIFLAFYAIWHLVRMKNRKLTITLVAFLISLPFLAYVTLPTFKARARYILYDFSFVQKGEYLPGSNDGARVMSLKAGWQLVKQNPLGVGAGDIMHEADNWYAVNVPHVLSTDKFYPSSEWLMYGGFAGWVGVILFTMIMLLPFFIKMKQHKIFWIAFNATAAFSFAFDMGLEVQYGIFLYAFILFWWWKWGYGENVKRETRDLDSIVS